MMTNWELTLEPLGQWPWLATGLAVIVMAWFLLRSIPGYWRALGSRWSVKLAAILFTGVAFTSLAAAAWNPVLLNRSGQEAVHVAVVVDRSASVYRTDRGWAGEQVKLADVLERQINGMAEGLRVDSTASIVLFGKEAQTTAGPGGMRFALAGLPEAIRRLQGGSLDDTETNIAVGLELALTQVAEAGGRGAIVLVSDGFETTGDAWLSVERALQKGIPVFIYPLIGEGFGTAITDADLPPTASSGTVTYLRGQMLDAGETRNLSLRFTQNAGLPTDGDWLFVSSPPQELSLRTGSAENTGWIPFRAALNFQGYGLQYADVELFDADRTLQRRRFYSYIQAPARILAIGTNLDWLHVLADAPVEVDVALPKDLTPDRIAGYDGIVLSEVFASQLPSTGLIAIADAVQQRGVGLFVTNGAHVGRELTEETVLMSYVDTPLGNLLPLEPQSKAGQAPPRQIIIVIDVSGSMEGAPLEQSKEIVASILERELKETDTLDLVAFSDAANHLLGPEGVLLTNSARRTAQDALESMGIGGGTNPAAAIQLLAERTNLSNCGLIFISDGGFSDASWITGRPECNATVFAIGHGDAPVGTDLARLAYPIPVGPGFDPATVTIPYFEPRQNFFDDSTFSPLATTVADKMLISVPELPLTGWAVSYARPESQVMAVVPRLAEPVLAFRTDPESGGVVGTLTTAFSPDWLSSTEGQYAVQAWILETLKSQDRARYHIVLRDLSARLQLHLVVRPDKDGRIPTEVRADAKIIDAQGGTLADWITLKPSADGAPASFDGFLAPARSGEPVIAQLLIRELGGSALANVQRIPMVVPREGTLRGALTSEAYSYGTQLEWLAAVADATGGANLSESTSQILAHLPVPEQRTVLWPMLTVVAALAFLAAIAVHRWGL